MDHVEQQDYLLIVYVIAAIGWGIDSYLDTRGGLLVLAPTVFFIDGELFLSVWRRIFR
jgi:hypothetical protein